MSRPVGASAERTQERLLSAAAGHFAACGWEATSLRSVAKDAGVSLATIHHYFGSKRALYEACIGHIHETMRQELAPLVGLLGQIGAALDAGADLGDLAAEWAVTGLRLARAQRQGMRVLMRELLDNEELEPTWRDQALLPFLEMASTHLAESTGRPPALLRLDVQTLTAVITRHALSNDAELVALTGAADITGAVALLEEHVGGMAKAVVESR